MSSPFLLPTGPCWLWFHDRVWGLEEAGDLLRACGRDPALLEKPAALLVAPEPPPPGRLPHFKDLRFRLLLLTHQHGSLLLFFRPRDLHDWEVAGLLCYECSHDRPSLWAAAWCVHEAAQQLDLSRLGDSPEDQRLAFLTGFTRRAIQVSGAPPAFCPLARPKGIFLEQVELGPDPDGSSTRQLGWLLLRPWRRIEKQVLAPPPPPEAVELDPKRLAFLFLPWG